MTAIFAATDEIAIAVMKGLREAGRRVPDDVSVVGFDDMRFDAALTSYNQNFHEMGERAFRMLYGQIEAQRTGREPPPAQVEVVQGRPRLRASERTPLNPSKNTSHGSR